MIYHGKIKYGYDTKEHTPIRNYTIVNLEDYRNVGFIYKDPKIQYEEDFYAFGILVNLFHTKVIPIDFDSVGFNDLSMIINKLMIYKKIEAIDVINSTPDEKRKWHLIIQTYDYVDASSFLDVIPFACNGFINCARAYKESTLRVSQKFFKNQCEGPTVQYLEGYRKIDDIINRSTNFHFITNRQAPAEPRRRINFRS